MKDRDSSVKFFLIVDDLQHQRVAMKTAIRQAVRRSEFIEADTLLRAKKIVEGTSEPIDVAVVDLRLEGSDEEGVELIKTLKRTPHREQTAAILITAYPDDKSRLLADQAGADAYISKLDNSVTEELQDAITRLL